MSELNFCLLNFEPYQAVGNSSPPSYFCQMENIIQIHDLRFKPFIAEAQIHQRVSEIGQEITRDYAGKSPIFVGMLNGAFIFLADLVRQCELDVETAFVKIASYAGVQSTGKIDLQLDLKKEITGRHVIIVEDIIDTGRTMHFYTQQLALHKPASVQIATLLVKPTAMIHKLNMRYVGFEIPDKFVVGYGLDYDELGRNLKGIYQLAG